MKQQIKNAFIFSITCITIFSIFGAVYAAWNDTVNTGDTFTADIWNDLVDQVETISTSGGVITQNSSFNAVGINHTPVDGNYQLDIRSANEAYVRIVSMDNTSAGIELVRVSGGSGDHALVNQGAALFFRTKDSGPWVDRSVMHQAGQFHVGTTNKTNNEAQLVVQTKNTQDILKLYEAEGVEVFTVKESGNVGIGTTDPGSRMSIVGLPSGTSGTNAGLDGSSVGALCMMSDGDVYIDTDGVCN